jgi:acetyltransferase-like isoleucine patch superfamily enzyme
MGYDVVAAGSSPWLREQLDDPRVAVGAHTWYEGPIRLGLWSEDDRIEIGRFSWIAREAMIFGGGNHASKTASAFDFSHLFGPEGLVPREHTRSRPTRIGNDVWIGWGATILPGAQLGDGAMVGARAVVAGTVPPYTVVAGNPARPLRLRFRDDTVRRLLQCRWWDWDLDCVRRALPMLHANPDDWPADFVPTPDAPVPKS